MSVGLCVGRMREEFGDGNKRQHGSDHLSSSLPLSQSKLDYDNYLWVTLLPPSARPPALALRAFNAETAAAAASADAARALAVGRCLWWKDAAASAAAGTPPSHPVARALAAAVAEGAFSGAAASYRLGRLATARADDAAATAPPPSLETLEEYGEATAAQVLYLHLDAVGVGGGEENGGAAAHSTAAAASHHAASHIGTAAALTAVLRGTGPAARARRCRLPSALLAAFRVSEEALFRGAADVAAAAAAGTPLPPPIPGLPDVAADVAAAAGAHLAAARRLAGDVDPRAVPCLRQAVGIERALAALDAVGCDPLHPTVSAGGGAGAAAGLVLATRVAAWRRRF